ncbi:polynucleotide adenylyltransferase PcnB [Oleiagrimonas soli]|uniref:Poly(A) polymerase I n=1 Tax=Oleiagrimonas soli TaxID=1543381 RepID=A0A099CW88_9GAMM|nr:polynucleotide adenylyltransferase PcnB [Oleiagrimonas soli]KGI77902.1 poly(A) polymerase [Oleiagrimonas soli]MBB6183731.1 poly(A) polymerase [Oleiagrimonas soli]
MNPEKSNISAPSTRIIPRDQHTVSRRNISKAALRVLYTLHEAGYRALLVGGAVRDLLIGVQPKDFDVATDATPEQVRKLFRNCRLIGRRFRLAHVVFGREIIEVATFRGSGEAGDGETDGDRHIVDGRIVRDNIWGSIEEDALRRDFRVNAMYYDIADFSVRDDVGGMQDLHDRVLHLIGDPETRYREDPVRMLRAARLAAKLDFDIDPSASAPFAELASLLGEAAPARLFDESLKLFMAGYALKSFRMLRRYGLLAPLFPATARALDGGDDELLSMIEQGMANTDARVAEDKPVTPAFLFAVLLWGDVRAQAQALIDDGIAPALAWQRAAHRVIANQTQHVAIPRRFTHVMEDIWTLQPRFAQRTRKRVFRLLEHPRFRAAYDFLLLRAGESDDIREQGQWWTTAQEQPTDQLAEQLVPSSRGGKSGSGTRKRRRRRGGRRKAGGSDSAE